MEALCFLDDHAEILGVLVTVLIAVIGVVIGRRAKRIQDALAWNEYRKPILDFANEAIFTFSDAGGLCQTDHKRYGEQRYWEKHNALTVKFSALLDQGRLVIPNRFRNDNLAFGGIRQEALDCLLAGFEITNEIDFTDWEINHKPFSDGMQESKKIIRQKETICHALRRLPDQESIKKIDKKIWTCELALVQAKRQFVDAVSKLLQSRSWVKNIESLLAESDRNKTLNQ